MNARTLVLGLVLLAPLSPADAQIVVFFSDGRTLAVESLRLVGSHVELELLGGSSLVVPAARIESHRPYVVAVPQQAPQAVIQAQPSAWTRLAGEYADMIALSARRHGVDPALLAAVAEVESNFDPFAVSHKGAEGLLQLMPATARRFGVQDSFDPEQNVEGGAQYLEWLLSRFAGDESLALAGYNAGEGAVDRHQGIPPYRETERYVGKVLARVETLRAGL